MTPPGRRPRPAVAQHAPLALGALALEAIVGYPDALHRHAPHPVTWAGAAISGLEERWNDPSESGAARRARGIATVVLVVGGAAAAGVLLQRVLDRRARWLLPVLATTGLAQKSLYDHVSAVLTPLEAGDLSSARTAVGRIVGRDVGALDESGVAAAAIESLAESFCDGVAAPAFWLALLGLPGLFAYKAANTADSLVGHMEPRWREFGWAAARFDDLLNLAPARLSGALIALAGGRGWRTMVRDAPKHASPNAGWPEAAMAGALGVQLGGPIAYDGVDHARPTFGDGRPPGAADLRKALGLYVGGCALLWLGLAGASAWRR